MAWKWADDIRETTLSSGSPMTLAGADGVNKKTFASFMSNGDTTDLTISDGTNTETGEWSFNAGVITRVTCFESTNSNNPVSWGGGSKTIACTPLAFRFRQLFNSADGVANRIRYDAAQTITAPQKAQTRKNIAQPKVSFSSNNTLVEDHRGAFVSLTSTGTLSLTAAATLADGYWCFLANEGTGIWTIDPNSTELIDGASTITLGPGDRCIIACDGSAFRTFAARAMRSKIISFTRDLSAANGAVGYTGVGFKPSAVILHGSDNQTSWGHWATDSTGAIMGLSNYGNTAVSVNPNTGIIYMGDNTAANYVQFTMSYDADGFTLTYSKIGSPTGTVTFRATCLR